MPNLISEPQFADLKLFCLIHINKYILLLAQYIFTSMYLKQSLAKTKFS